MPSRAAIAEAIADAATVAVIATLPTVVEMIKAHTHEEATGDDA